MNFSSGGSLVSYELRNTEYDHSERPLLSLHSALSSRKEFDKLSSFYPNRKQILLDFPSQGESNAGNTKLTTLILAETVHSLLEELKIYSVDIIGYSLGGYIALEMARITPSTIHSIVSHGMKFYWTEAAISESLVSLDIEKIKMRSQKGYEILSAIHSGSGLETAIKANRCIVEHFREVQLTEEDLYKIQVPLLLSVGDRDELVTLTEITKLFSSRDPKKTFLAIHPNSPHPISKLDLISFTNSVRIFWKDL